MISSSGLAMTHETSTPHNLTKILNLVGQYDDCIILYLCWAEYPIQLMSTHEIKKQICTYILELLSEKAETAGQAIASAKESRNNDTKSSAGDKFETGRAMMQMEMDKSQMQLSKILEQQKDLTGIDLTKTYTKVEYGSLVQTNGGWYFMSIGYGKVTVSNNNYYVISMASPIGQALKGKEAGSTIQFQGREITIEAIV